MLQILIIQLLIAGKIDREEADRLEIKLASRPIPRRWAEAVLMIEEVLNFKKII